jgi:phage shock protein E
MAYGELLAITNRSKRMIELLKNLLGIKPATDFAALMKQGAIVVDVRTPAEFKSGHIRGSINIPLNQLRNNLHRLRDKHKPVISCCASGARSRVAATLLRAQGYTQVYNGGGWMRLESKIL